jgi:hypothetical protein
VISVGLNGEEVAQGHGGGCPPRSGSSAGRLVRCGGRSARARVGRLWRRKEDHAWLDQAQKRGVAWGAMWRRGREGALVRRGMKEGGGGPAGSRTQAWQRQASVGRCTSRGGGGFSQVDPAWKREEAHGPRLENVGRPRRNSVIFY